MAGEPVAAALLDGLLDDLLGRIARLRANRPAGRVIVGITGAPGAGKSTLAEALVARLAAGRAWQGSEVAHVPMDGFHLADAELDRLGLRDRKGAPETFDPGGYAALLARISAGEQVWAPAFERTLEQPIAQSLPVTAATRVVISEGNYLLLADGDWSRVRALCDEIWFCRTDDAVRRERLITRHMQFGKTPDQAREWVLRSDERNAALVAGTQAAADLVVDLG